MKQLILGAAVALALGIAASDRAAAQTAEDQANESAGAPAADSTTTETAETARDAADAAATESAPDAAATDATTDPFAEPAASSSSAADTTEPATSAAQQNAPDVDVQPPATSPADDAAPPTTGDPAADPAQPSSDPSIDVDASAQPGRLDADVDAAARSNLGTRAGAAIAGQRNLATGLQFGQATARGLALQSVARDSFFFRHGLRPGDVLVSYGGRPIRSQADFNRWVVYQPGQRVPVVVVRDGRPETIYVTYQRQTGNIAQQGPDSGAYLGVSFDRRFPEYAVVSRVAPGSPAEEAGLATGDVIVGINGERVTNAQHVVQLVGSLEPESEIDLAISRRLVLGTRHNVARPATAPRAAAPAAIQPAAPELQPSGPQDATPLRPAQDFDAQPGLDARPIQRVDPDRDGRILDGDVDRDGRLLDND